MGAFADKRCRFTGFGGQEGWHHGDWLSACPLASRIAAFQESLIIPFPVYFLFPFDLVAAPRGVSALLMVANFYTEGRLHTQARQKRLTLSMYHNHILASAKARVASVKA